MATAEGESAPPLPPSALLWRDCSTDPSFSLISVSRPRNRPLLLDRIYELSFLQQPERGAAVGLEGNPSSRLPVLPGPVLRVIIRDEEGKEV